MNKYLDKIAHCFVSYFLCSLFDVFTPIITSCVIAFMIGIFKEVYDKSKGGKFDYIDLIADITGITLYLLILCVK